MSKTIVITGSTRGLGKLTAIACLEAGANVVISSESTTDLNNTLLECVNFGQVEGMLCDVSQLDQIIALKDFAIAHFGSIDCWINNAGTTAPGGLTSQTPFKFGELVIQTNILGTYYGSTTAIRQFRSQGKGRLINITGRGEKSPQAKANLYSSAKTWIRNFTLALAKEEQASDINIATFNPGLILTALTQTPRVLAGEEKRVIKGLKMVMPIIGNRAEKAAQVLSQLALSDKPIPKENQTQSMILLILKRLLTGQRADIDVELFDPVIIAPEK